MRRSGPTIYEVARAAGVSIATVSRVQNGGPVAEDTREHVRRVMDDLAYRPNASARALADRRHGATGLVFPDLSGPYYAEVILGYEDRTARDGRAVLILGTRGRARSEELVHDLGDRVDGLVVMGHTVSDAAAAALGSRVPLVLLARSPLAGLDCVCSEGIRAAEELTGHLLDVHGLRRLAYLAGEAEAGSDTARRHEGFVRAHRARGLEPAPPVLAGYQEHEGHAAARRLLAGAGRPDALVCVNDEVAVGALRAARELGLAIPRDLAVTGWDDLLLARLADPPLTTARQPIRQLGALAATILSRRIDGDPSQPRHHVLPTPLAIRASCGCSPTEGDGR